MTSGFISQLITEVIISSTLAQDFWTNEVSPSVAKHFYSTDKKPVSAPIEFVIHFVCELLSEHYSLKDDQQGTTPV